MTPDGERIADSSVSPTDDPTPTPETYRSIATHEELIRWSAAYCASAIDEYHLSVDLEAVAWDVSTRAKRRAAAVKTPTVPGAAVGTPVDWSETPTDSATGTPPTCTMSLSWRAVESFDCEEWTATLRHELVHVEQFQSFGATDHGPSFKRRADAVDAPVRVRRFADPKYVLTCTDCGDEVAHRYRDCKLVRRHRSYRSTCCEAPLSCRGPSDE